MYDNQTDIIYDDKIIKLQYSGFTAEGWTNPLIR
jgi:hypothetical protein